MTQTIFVWGSIIVLVRLVWVLVLDILVDTFGDKQNTHDKRLERTLPEQRD